MIRRLPTHQLVLDVVLAAAYLLVVVVAASGLDVSVLPAVVYAVALGVRRVGPGLALAIAWVGAILQMTVAWTPGPPDLAILGVLYACAAYGDRVLRSISLGSVFLGSVIATLWLVLVGSHGNAFSNLPNVITPSILLNVAAAFVALTLLLGVSWLLGLLRRTFLRADENVRAREEAEREVAAEQERTAIARDMHDVVAHSLAVVIAQADGARYQAAALGDTDAARTVTGALDTIAGTARGALGDVRGLLARLRHREAPGPQPGFAELDRLIADVAAGGLPIDDRREPLPADAPVGIQLAVYRIAQEALTNALRHGDRDRAVVVSARRVPAAGELVLQVSNGVRSTDAAGSATRFGHGVIGMTERASIAGGSVSAGREGEVWVVTARLPLAETEDES